MVFRVYVADMGENHVRLLRAAVLVSMMLFIVPNMAVSPAKAAATITSIQFANVVVSAPANCALFDAIVTFSIIVNGTPGGSGVNPTQTTLGGSGVPITYNGAIPDAQLGVAVDPVSGTPGSISPTNGSGWTTTNGTAMITVTVVGVGSAVLTINCVTRTFTVQNWPPASASSGVTFFNPNDNRVDPRPGDRLAVWCNQPDKVVVYGVSDDLPANQSGFHLATFSYKDVVAAGDKGLSRNTGSTGIITVSLKNGWFWIAWNGGKYRATGQGIFIKNFEDAKWCSPAHPAS
jgi:hypothetical protein